ncbi:DUF2155 domain-containing protein [Maricaulis sp. CAU 1757]
MKTVFTASIAALGLSFHAMAQDEPDLEIEPTASGTVAEDVIEDPDLRAYPNEGPLSSQPGSLVVLRGLDKVTAETRDFELPIGETLEFGALQITAHYCRKRPPEETPETYAFLQVIDRRTDGFGAVDEGQQIFSGWMLASRPAQNPLEHAIYDVWVLDCRA